MSQSWTRTLIVFLLALFLFAPIGARGIQYTQLVVERIEVSPADIYPGDHVTIKVVLWNGVGRVYHVQTQLKIASGDPFVCIGPTLIPVGNLEFDERATVEYHLRVSNDARPKSYSLTLEIPHIGIKHETKTKTASVTTYEDTNTTRTETTPVEMVTLWSYADVVVTETIHIVVKDATNARLTTIDVDAAPSEVLPGERFSVSATVGNEGAFVAREATVQLDLKAEHPFVPLSPTVVFLGDIEPGETVDLSYSLLASGSAKAQPYVLQLTLSYLDRYHQPASETESVSVVVRDVADAQLVAKDVLLTPSEVLPGGMVTISTTFDNAGSFVAREVTAQLKVSPEHPLVPLTPTLISLGQIEPNGRAELSYSLLVSESAKAQPYVLQIVMTYLDRYRQWVSETESVSVVVKDIANARLVAKDIMTTPREVLPGQRVAIGTIVENTGGFVAREVTAQLKVGAEHPFSPLSPTVVFLGDIEPGETVDLSYSLLASGSAKAQPYVLQLTLSYLDRYHQPASETESVAVPIHSITSFQLLNLQELSAEPGGTIILEADLLLIGTESVRFVGIELAEDQTGPFIATPESHEYIGQVDPDSPVPFIIEFEVDPNAKPGIYSANVRVIYWDEYNNVREITLKTPAVIAEAIKGQEVEGGGYTIWDLLKILFGIRP